MINDDTVYERVELVSQYSWMNTRLTGNKASGNLLDKPARPVAYIYI